MSFIDKSLSSSSSEGDEVCRINYERTASTVISEYKEHYNQISKTQEV